ncbi:ammonium transporter [Nitrospira sp.]|nr:ammonium transporter [Nitrospira sp.]
MRLHRRTADGLALASVGGLVGLLIAGVGGDTAWAQSGQPGSGGPNIDSGDTAWMLASTALVLVMIVPGLALYYGGLVRKKNALATIMHGLSILCAVSLAWVVVGYTLTFGTDLGGMIGSLEWMFLSGVGLDPHRTYGPTVPHQAVMLFQLMLAAFTPVLISGALAERVRFSAMLLFALLWSLIVYAPVAHWLWGGGWLSKLGALDFAGGAVVHINSGVAALVCALVLGQRRGYRTDYIAPHNLPLTLLGAGLLWFGWFGLNAGRALGANGVAVTALVATHLGAASGGLMWMFVEWKHRGKSTVLGMASGAVAGLTTVTAAAGYVGPFSSILIGAIGACLCYLAIVWKGKFGYDDALDVVGIHGVGGILGILATGLFASKAVNAGGADGLFFGGAAFFGVQALTVCAVTVFSIIVTYILLKVVDGAVGLRVTPDEEASGLDLSGHNERAYS